MKPFVIIAMTALMLSGCDMDKNISLCGQLGMCEKEKIEQDAMCEHYGTCKKEDGEEDDDKPIRADRNHGSDDDDGGTVLQTRESEPQPAHEPEPQPVAEQ